MIKVTVPAKLGQVSGKPYIGEFVEVSADVGDVFVFRAPQGYLYKILARGGGLTVMPFQHHMDVEVVLDGTGAALSYHHACEAVRLFNGDDREAIERLEAKRAGSPVPMPPPQYEFEIWSEGFAATGERGSAQLVGAASGLTFREACANFALEDEAFAEYFDSERLTFWGCRLFTNENDARRSFG